MIHWLQIGRFARMRRTAARLLLGAAFCTASTAAIANVVIVDSDKHGASYRLAEGIAANCTGCGTVSYMDMHHDRGTGDAILTDLRDRKAKGELELVITLGPLATRLVTEEMPDTPVYFLMREKPSRKVRETASARGMQVEPDVGLRLAAFKALAPHMQTVGVLARRSTIEPVRDELIAAAGELGIKLSFFYIERPDDVSPGLRQAIGDTDGLLFLRDIVVINTNTIRFILRMTLENRIPTFAYSPDLVPMGMGAAIEMDPAKLAEQVGRAAGALVQGDKGAAEPWAPFLLEVNRSSLESSGGITPSTVLGMEVVLK